MLDKLMNEPTTVVTPEPTTVETTVIDKEFTTLERNSFEKTKTGFHFWTISWKNLAKAVEKYSEEGVLTLLNQSLSFNLRNKASNSLPIYPESPQKQAVEWDKLRKTAPLLLTVEDVEAYVPGERDKGYVSLMKEFKQAKKDGKIEEAKLLLKRAMALAEAELV